MMQSSVLNRVVNRNGGENFGVAPVSIVVLNIVSFLSVTKIDKIPQAASNYSLLIFVATKDSVPLMILVSYTSPGGLRK